MSQRIIGVLQIVNTFLQDVAEDPSRLKKAMEHAEKQIREELVPLTMENVNKELTFDQCARLAQAILDVRGKPPYTKEQDISGDELSMDIAQAAELRIISDFVYNWRDHLIEKAD